MTTKTRRPKKPRPPNPLDRDNWLWVLGYDAKRWAKRWGITIPEAVPCFSCNAPLTCTIPFVMGKVRGLASPTCVCGFTGTPYCMVRADGGFPLGGDL